MIAQLSSELLKLRTTRTVGLLLLAATGLTALGVVVEGISSTLAELAGEEQQRTLLGAGSSGAVVFATFAGLIAVTSEFRYGTIRPTLLVQPRRRVVLAAKLAAAALAGALFAVVCMALSLGAGLAILSARGVDVAPGGADFVALAAGTTAAAALSALLGVAIGALIRNQVGAIVAVVAYAFLIDATLFAAVPGVGRYLPGKAGDALAGQPVEHLLSPALGALVLAAWTVALVAAATVRNDRSDV
ncbi:MAG TPA: ABC transporter permease [Gaiellaceae bacterium]|nr:ABC transporter permease [Gaiellaceae bacterium]